MPPKFFRTPKSQTLFHVRSKGDCPIIVPRSWHYGRREIRQLSLSLWTRGIDCEKSGYYLLTEDEQCHYIPNLSHKKVVDALRSHRPAGWMQRSKVKSKTATKAKTKSYQELKIDFTTCLRNSQRDRIKQLLASAQRSRNKRVQSVRVRAF